MTEEPQFPATPPAQPARTPSAPSSGDPFAPDGIVFTPVSTSLITARLIAALPWFVLPLLAFAVLAITISPWFWIGAGTFALVTIWLLWLIPRQVRAIGYAEAEDDLLVKKGVAFKKLSVIPYGRMQYVDVNQGPVVRRFGISQVTLYTASPTTDATLPGLPQAEAHRLRDRLTARGEARLAGL
ncbi:hypothetical protein SAMN06298212_1216 [Ruaniaceae bacterium KH17]|nr:hypothetical protein SAMN06298212_1216 [Ruaniaceae bacterium KH17]